MHFIHTGDLHLGASPNSNTQWAKERTLAIRNSLPRIIALAKMENADLLLITGDLFNRVPIHRELKEADYYFSQIPRTRVVIIAGNHDYISDYSPYRDFTWSKNVALIGTPSVSSVYFEDINTEVHGFSYTSREITSPVLDGIRAPKDGRIHILMAHGGDASHVPIALAKLAASGFDYIALGHIHKPRIFNGTHMAYCGCPEPLNSNDVGPRGLLSGDITEAGFDLKWRKISDIQYREFEIEVNSDMTEAEVSDCIRAELATHPEDIYNIVLKGARTPGLTFDEESILRLGRVAKVTDNTEPAYDIEKLLREHSGDLIAHYINELSGEGADPLRKRALYYGLGALLGQND